MSLGRSLLPPVVYGECPFGGPVKPFRRRALHGRQGRVDSHIKITNLLVTANRRMVRKSDVRMRRVDQINPLDLLDRIGRRYATRDNQSEQKINIDNGSVSTHDFEVPLKLRY